MASDRLYIVGNGFDLHHRIPSTYRHFAAWLAQADYRIFRLVEEYFSGDEDFWADFEQRLAEFDADQAVDYAMQFHSDERHGDFQYECEQIATGLSSGLRGRFAEWIRGLQIPVRSEIARPIVIDPDALFLSFNYTPTLEHIYGIPRGQILHIHGYGGDPTETLVLGHGWERRPEDKLNFKPVGPDDDWRIRDGMDYLDDYFTETFKPTVELIAKHQAFFDGLSHVRDIFILGHGLANVDEPYFSEIMDRVDLTATRWTVSIYHDLAERRACFGAYGIAPHLVRYLEMTDFD
ncbi:bacteriophage abortive infection AbiH family protein [Sphingobium sp. LMC3-1-1.1]|uniref:bacteriophage abortive infection AbiH family protein n=1 Tax=Sphingobium sp. LMC3-1-1.1 TaxID=3135241 RepID=UPI0034218013